MKTVLYNTYTNLVIFEFENGYKDENGNQLHIDPPVVELEVIEICPVFDFLTQNRTKSIEVDLTLKQYKHVWVVTSKSVEELAIIAEQQRIDNLINSGWHHPEFAKRIVAPVQLVMQYPAVETWFRINDLPIVRNGGTLYCYCNLILPAHQQLVDATAGIVTIQDRPIE